jgi:hypothetical protein
MSTSPPTRPRSSRSRYRLGDAPADVCREGDHRVFNPLRYGALERAPPLAVTRLGSLPPLDTSSPDPRTGD